MHKLKMLGASHLSQKYELEDKILKHSPQKISHFQQLGQLRQPLGFFPQFFLTGERLCCVCFGCFHLCFGVFQLTMPFTGFY